MTQICVTCGTQFPPSDETPRSCPICRDDRQFIGTHGQEWISLDELRKTHRNVFFEEGWRVWGIHTEPEFGIGQRALLLQRHSLIVDVDAIDLKSGIQIRERTKDLNLYGCGVSTGTPFPAGTKVKLKLAYGAQKITVFGKVIYGRQDIGMGIVFTTVEPEDQKLLEDWIAELSILQ